MKTYELTDEQIDRITGMVENAVASAVRDAVLAVVGHKAQPKQRQGRKPIADKDANLAKRILAVLDAAPANANEAPAHLQAYLAQRSMPKTILRNRVGNGYKGFDAVLEKLVADGQVMTGKCPTLNKRYMVLFGLP